MGVRVEMPSNQPIVLLKEIGGDRYLPIWVGAVEATAIAFAQQGVQPPRPLTHDLMKDLIESMGRRVDSVHLTELKDGVFYSMINMDADVSISSRPSDAIALALRTGSPILASEEYLQRLVSRFQTSPRKRSRNSANSWIRSIQRTSLPKLLLDS